MPSPPIIALPADVKEIDGYRWHAAAEPYLRAVTVGIGAIPMIVPALAGFIAPGALLERVDGVLLTGSRSNVHPALYGQSAPPETGPHDEARDALTLPLIRAAIEAGVPLFAICRGMQELNVALGGTLHPEIHEVEGRQDHRAPVSEHQSERFAIRQDVHVAPGSQLGRIVSSETIRVNSLHRQGIDRLGAGLVVEATAADGTIEAVRVADAPGFAIGVQWHPEYWVETDRPSGMLFAAFGRAVRAYVAERDSVPAAVM